MIIPYDENDRRDKFDKLYNECSQDINKYIKLYENESFE